VERKSGALVLSVVSSRGRTANEGTCTLRGFWIQTQVAPGDEIMIIGKFDDEASILIDDEKNFLILHPDTLISPTLIGGTSYCARKALLQEMIRSETTMEMFIGTLVHDLMQRIAVAVSKVAKTNGELEKKQDKRMVAEYGSFSDNATLVF
jgi:uncharacterized small protein (DUF1192 family)